MPAVSFADLANERISTSRGAMLTAFAYVLETSGCRRVTDLHVRRLLKYVRAHDRYYTGVPRSLARLARKLVLSVPTCRRVIRRAVEEFNLLIVIPQRHNPGGQTVNRYTINWDNVDALLYDADNANCPSDSLPSLNPMPVRLAPDHLKSEVCPLPVRLAPEACPLPVRPAPRDDSIDDLILHDRLLNSHPRILLVPDHLFPNPWPYPLRRFPRETPKELMAHFDVVLAKLQTAMDSAQELKAWKIYNRLQTLRCDIEAVQFRASHAAMCRTNLPPVNPIRKPTWGALPSDLSARSSQILKTAPIDFSQFDFSWLADTAPAREDQATALSDHPPTFASAARALPEPSYSLKPKSPVVPRLASAARTLPESSYSLNTYSLQPKSPVVLRLAHAARTDTTALSDHPQTLASAARTDDPEVFSLLIALDDLTAALTAAAQCARECAIEWLQESFTTFRRHTKTIRTATHVLNPTHHPCPEPAPQIPLHLPTA